MEFLNTKKIYIILLLIMIFVFFFTLFYHINFVPFDSWDESRHGVSSLEMVAHKNWIINTWIGKPDLWNLKPILSFAPTCIAVSLFGKSILTIRLFSIFSAILLCSYVCFYTYKKYNVYTAILFLSLLFTASLIIRNHAFRSGDADSFFLLCQIIVITCLSNKADTKHLSISAFFSALAFLCKSWHALFMGLPYLIAYGSLLKNKQLSFKSLLFPFIAFFIPISIWLALRYPFDGFTFIKEMYNYDLVKRSTQTISDHYHNNFYYFKKLIRHFSVITFTFLFSCVYSFIIRKRKFLTYDIIILFSAILSSLLIYSAAETKLHWYGYTHVILMCITSAILIGRDVYKSTKIFILFLSIIALLYNIHTLQKISHSTLPLYYSVLKTHQYPTYQAIYIPQNITQAERMAIMVLGHFNYDTIKHGQPEKNTLVFYRVGAIDNSDIKGCHPLSEEKLQIENEDQYETIRLYACQALK